MTLALAGALLTACGGGGGGSSPAPFEQETITGKVIDGYVSDATVCIDLNANGHCDSNEAQTLSGDGGTYTLSIPKGSNAPLIAEIVAGRSRDSAAPGTFVDRSFRMASPSKAYGTNVTPFTTLVYLTGVTDYALAEALVRDIVGLPPRYAINADYGAEPASLTYKVAASVAVALKGAGNGIDLSSPAAMQQIVAQFPTALTTLPVLRIVTKDAAPIVSKETYVDATFQLTNPAISTDPVPLNGKIRGRGHSTWGQPKNPYKVQFSNDAAWAAIPDVLGMQKNRNWALLADYFDKSLMRNKLALTLGNTNLFAEGLKWTSSGQHLEVYLNGDYVGVYLLTEDIRIDPARLAIKKMSSNPSVGDVDGGYIVEVDFRLDCYAGADVDLQHYTPQGAPVCVDTPDETAITPAQLAYIKGLIDSVETEIYGGNLPARINAVSYVDWYLLQELFRNNDAAFISSDYMWKDTEAAAKPADRLLNMGPIWDFDISAGNITYNDNWKVEGCWVSRPTMGLPNWSAQLLKNPAFLNLVLTRWRDKRPGLETFINTSIDTYTRRLDAAQQRNFARWPVFGVPLLLGDYYLFPTYAQQVAFLRSFLIDRMAWLDNAFASVENFDAMCR
jgi:hypothetical protein